MDDKIWYREELEVMRDLVLQEIGAKAEHHGIDQRVALGHLYGKLLREIEGAPNMAGAP